MSTCGRKELFLAFLLAYGRVSLKELVFQNVSKPYTSFEDYTHKLVCITMVFSPTDGNEHVWYRGMSFAMQNIYCRTRVVVRAFQHTLSGDVRMPRVCALLREKNKNIR